jgi:SAM-dependent methyltransferase
MKKNILRIAIHIVSFVHNWCYKFLTKLSILENDGLHPKHRILNYHAFFVDHVETTDVVVDIGCGNGANAYDVAAKASFVVGIDMNEKNVEKSKKKYRRDNLSYIVGDATTYTFDRRFDKIVLSNVLEHIEHRISFLRSLKHISDVILLRVPMIDRDWVVVYKQEHGIDYRLDPTHFIEFTDESLRKELSEAGWKVESHSVQFGEWWGVVKSA